MLNCRSQAVMKEALRLHPGVAFPLEREVPAGGALICGVHLPAGTNVGITAPVIHHNRDVFGEDADDFKPERWTDASKEQLKVMDRSFLAVCFIVLLWSRKPLFPFSYVLTDL